MKTNTPVPTHFGELIALNQGKPFLAVILYILAPHEVGRKEIMPCVYVRGVVSGEYDGKGIPCSQFCQLLYSAEELRRTERPVLRQGPVDEITCGVIWKRFFKGLHICGSETAINVEPEMQKGGLFIFFGDSIMETAKEIFPIKDLEEIMSFEI